MVGQTAGKYRIVDRIGRGSMGTVYRALDTVLHRSVAIKVLNADLNDPAAGRRFRGEAVAVARLNHPGIAKVYDLFEHDGQWIMAMELVDGETLESLVGRTGPMSAEQTADLAEQALTALSHAHAVGVVHRDLKPANLMVAGGRLKITDFGIARVAGTEHLTSAGLMMGTPAYMAPEQVAGQEIDARTDVFALGCVMFFLATATLPFKGKTPMELVQARLRDDPTPVRTVRQELPVWFGRAVDRALARNPANRFQTADEFRRALERGLAGLPAGPETPRAETVSPEAMETMLPGRMAVVADAVQPTVMSRAATPPALAPPVRVEPAPPARRSRSAVVIGALVLVAAIAVAVQVFRPSQKDLVSPPVPTAVETPTPSPTVGAEATPNPIPVSEAELKPAPVAPSASGATPSPTVASGRRGLSTDVPVSFDTVKLLRVTGKHGEDVDATLTIGGVTIVVAPRPAGAPVVMAYKALLAATYVKDRDPKAVPNLAGPPADLDLPGGLLRRRPARPWLVLQGAESYLILVLSETDADHVLRTLADRSRVKIERPGAAK